MCGIAGKLFLDSSRTIQGGEIKAMLGPMAHRGPDGHGIHLDDNVGLGHLRLSIIDLGAGAQPMANEDESVWIVFNGEIYNYLELRERLVARGHVFRSHSDTEVIIHLYEEMGPDCVRDLRGMFAFAIWDAKRKRLFIARDRVGIKPLYYSLTGGAFYFASELKAIIADAAVPRDVSAEAIREFLSFYYVPGEDTLFRSIKKLLPGHSLIVEGGKITVREYWDLQFTDNRRLQPFVEAVDELRQLIASTVRDHMMADVPVGILLSGGMDSSAVLSYAIEGTSKQVKTFTVGFEGDQVVDERPYARLAAEKFKTDHYDLSISAQDFWNFLPAYISHMEEPVCEPPAVALYYVSKFARNQVKVLLSGEGGDEAFGGYPNYPNMMRLERIGAMAGPLAKFAGAGLAAAGRLSGDGRIERYGEAMGQSLASQYFSRTSNPAAFFNRHARKFFTSDFLADTASVSAPVFIASLVEKVADEPLLNQMLYVDSKTWLPDDLLVKADKITMATSLELRVPLLDHKVLEFAASLPVDYKVRGRETKRILKSAFAKTLPPAVIKRKKAGFPVPFHSWLRQELEPGVRDLLTSARCQNRGYFQPQRVVELLDRNQKTGSYSKETFCLLVLELWHRKFVDQA